MDGVFSGKESGPQSTSPQSTDIGMFSVFRDLFADAFTAMSEVHRQDSADHGDGNSNSFPRCNMCFATYEDDVNDDSIRSEARRPLGFAVDHDALLDSEGRRVVITSGRRSDSRTTSMSCPSTPVKELIETKDLSQSRADLLIESPRRKGI